MRKKMLYKIFILLVFMSACTHVEVASEKKVLTKPETEVIYNCETTREYITSYMFLQGKEVQLDSKQAHDLAQKVAQGCTDAAKRFIEVVNLLTKASLPHGYCFEVGLLFAHSSDEATEAFVSIFKSSYLSEYLDLDLYTSIETAKELALTPLPLSIYTRLASDFPSFVKFCLKQEGLAETRPYCAKLAMEVLKNSYDIDLSPARSYEELIEFLRDDKEGPQLVTAEAKKIANELIKVSPYATANFRSAFAFATNKQFLNLGREDAVNFASRLASWTRSK
jgi:hypothetical protein